MENIVTLYHGTSSLNLEKIQQEGLKSPYLTSSDGLAEYYAECEVEERGGEMVVLEIVIPSAENLRADFCSLEEPVGFDGYSIFELEERVSEYFEKSSIAEEDWEASLDLVGSCRYEGIITEFKEAQKN